MMCSFFTENLGLPSCVPIHKYDVNLNMYVNVCVYIYIYKTTYILHCVMKSQRLLLAIQSVPFLSTPNPAGACSSLSDCSGRPCSRNSLPFLLWPVAWIWGLVCTFQKSGFTRCDHMNMRSMGWASWSREELPLAWSLHLLLFPGAKQEPGSSLGEVNQRGIIHSRRLVGPCECQRCLSLTSSLQACWGAEWFCWLNPIPSKDRNKTIIIMFWQSKVFSFAGKGLFHVQPWLPLRMSKKEASLVKRCLPYQPALPRW